MSSGDGELAVPDRSLVVTVGQNPLPCLLAVRALKRPDVWFIASSDTAPLAYRVAAAAGLSVDDRVLIVEPTSIRDVQRTLCRAPLENTDLAFTGGTAVMAAESYRQWRDRSEQDDARAFYAVDRDHPVLRASDRHGCSCDPLDLGGIEIALGDIVALHGYTLADARECVVPALAELIATPNNRNRTEWATSIASALSDVVSEARANPRLKQNNQYDGYILCRVGARLTVLTIAVVDDENEVAHLKHHLMMAMLIAERLGGERARAGVCYLRPGGPEYDNSVTQAKGSLPDESYRNRFAVFTANDLEALTNGGGSAIVEFFCE